MANREKGEVDVNLPSGNLTLCLDFNGICEIEDLYGMSFAVFVETVAKGIEAGHVSLKDMRAILWAGMKRDEPQASLLDAGKIAGELGDRLGDVVGALLQESGMFDVVEDEAKVVGNAPKAKRKRKPPAK